MALFRFLLILLIFGSLAAIAVQNLTLVRLVILGQNTISLPLAVWLVGALGLGGLTSVLLTGLIEWTSFWSRRQERRYYSSAARDAAGRDGAGRDSVGRAPEPPPKSRWNPFGRQAPADDDDDAGWDRPAQPKPATEPSGFRPPAPPKEVVDADFRVIRPPSRRLDDE